MPSMKDIKRRIKSVQNSEQITKAMKMVAAAKFQKTQVRLYRLRQYVNGYHDLMQEIIDDTYPTLHPAFKPPTGNNILLVVVTASRGLCGGFNSNILKKSRSFLEENQDKNIRVITVGDKARRFFQKKHPDVLHDSFDDLADNYAMGNMMPVFRTLYDSFLSDDIDYVKIVYNQFKSAMAQEEVVQNFLPIDYIEPPRAENVVYEHYPTFELVVDNLVEDFLKSTLYGYLMESTTGEFGARMTAMSAATDNAAEMIENLTLQYNRARQAQITKEISEIVGGAEALKS